MPRYTLLFLNSKIYIVHVINCEWSRYVNFQLRMFCMRYKYVFFRYKKSELIPINHTWLASLWKLDLVIFFNLMVWWSFLWYAMNDLMHVMQLLFLSIWNGPFSHLTKLNYGCKIECLQNAPYWQSLKSECQYKFLISLSSTLYIRQLLPI